MLSGDADGWKAVDYINFKMSCAKLKQDSKWKLKVKECTELRDFFSSKAASNLFKFIFWNKHVALVIYINHR